VGITITILKQEIEGVVVTVVSELVVGRGKLVKTLSCNGREVSGELRVLS